MKLGVTAGELSLIPVWFGAVGFPGNMLMSRHVDRSGADRAVLLGIHPAAGSSRRRMGLAAAGCPGAGRHGRSGIIRA